MKTTKQRETKAAKQFDAKLIPASGATPWAKEDFQSDTFLFQHKEAKTKTHTVKRMDLVNLKHNAIDAGKNPVYIIDFDGDVWCMIPKSHFDILKEDYDV